jgi:hypothetical protein
MISYGKSAPGASKLQNTKYKKSGVLMNNYGILVFLRENSSFLWERGVANGKSLNDTSYGTKLALTDELQRQLCG